MRRPVTDSRSAVAYLRVSTDEQHLGPEAQRAAIVAWAAREGVNVVAWHTDAGVSGAAEIAKRPALLAALADLRAHRAGVLVEPDEAPPMGDPDDDGLRSPSLHARSEFDDGISLDALDARGDAALRSREPRALDTHPLPTVHAVPTVPTPANDDGGQP